jgi:AcrR family transcriptional regulator
MQRSTTLPRRRMTREESRTHTRERVLDSAAVIFRRDGFHRASIDEIAEEAGFSRGAVYSSFANKEEFFLALHDREARQRVQLIAARLLENGTLEDAARTAARTSYERHLADPGWSLVTSEFAVHAARNPDVARRLREQDRLMREASTRLIAEICARDCIQCGEREANEVVTAMMAIGCGITLEQQIAPDTVNPQMMEDLFVAAVQRISTPRPPGSL